MKLNTCNKSIEINFSLFCSVVHLENVYHHELCAKGKSIYIHIYSKCTAWRTGICSKSSNSNNYS